ncbi:dihydroorotase [Methanofollis aquaemaris]|uniref:Dihydroorotase n=1 Tax=Methanofollis aquaemaris TaxID=126734 RepID=A0A8A3S9T6_9EURY|nr:amidohydrolase family protein [Methanofollis aquaemaris]QSZ68304.1 dihydroorotase [Methanofollis aquaemaris]
MAGHAALVLRGLTLPSGRVADLSLGEGRVLHIGAGLPADESVDASGLLCLPAAVDMHTHLRGGRAQVAKEDWTTGTTSALFGGVTVVVDQPNTLPPLTAPDAFGARVAEAAGQARCRFAVNAGVVSGADLPALWRAGAMAFGEVFAGPSSYGTAVPPEVLGRAFLALRDLGALVTVHAEDPLPGAPENLAEHDRLRPASAEAAAVRAVDRLVPPGGRVHFCHMSSAAAVDAAVGTVEVTPHHLFLSWEQFEAEDTHARMNPPLRSEKERKTLWSRWDAIDVVASDHAPHTAAEKAVPFAEAPSGVPGVETMLPLLMAEVVSGRLSLASVVEKTAINPAGILGIAPAGFGPGERADFALYPREPTSIDPDTLHTKCTWTPFEGMAAVFPEIVVMDGACTVLDGECLGGGGAWLPGKGYNP